MYVLRQLKQKWLYVPELLCYVFFCIHSVDCSWHSSNNANNTANSIVRDCCSHLQYAIHCLKWDFRINSKKLHKAKTFVRFEKSSGFKIYNWLVLLLNAHYLKTKLKKKNCVAMCCKLHIQSSIKFLCNVIYSIWSACFHAFLQAFIITAWNAVKENRFARERNKRPTCIVHMWPNNTKLET